MKYKNCRLMTGAALSLLLSACSTTNLMAVDQVTESHLQHHNWELTQIDGINIPHTDGATKTNLTPHLEIAEKMQANGNAGCNGFFGQAELKNNQLRIEKMGMTMKMCPTNEMEIERALVTTLSEWSDITLTKEALELKNKHHTLTFVLRDWVN